MQFSASKVFFTGKLTAPFHDFDLWHVSVTLCPTIAGNKLIIIILIFSSSVIIAQLLQVVTAIYFVFIDVVMMTQYVFYQIRNHGRKGELLNDTVVRLYMYKVIGVCLVCVCVHVCVQACVCVVYRHAYTCVCVCKSIYTCICPCKNLGCFHQRLFILPETVHTRIISAFTITGWVYVQQNITTCMCH